MNYRTHFAHRIDMWDSDGENVIEHLAGMEDFEVAMATYRAACQRWPNAAITLRQGVIEDSRRMLYWENTPPPVLNTPPPAFIPPPPVSKTLSMDQQYSVAQLLVKHRPFGGSQ